MDGVTLAILKGRLEQIADEMDATLFRAAFNPTIAEAHDACHGLYHRTTGDTLVQGKSGLPIFVGTMAFATKADALLDDYGAPLVADALDELRARAATQMRAALAALPDGTWSQEDFLDNDGRTDQPLRIAVEPISSNHERTASSTAASCIPSCVSGAVVMLRRCRC